MLSEFQSPDTKEVKINSDLVIKLQELRKQISQPLKINSAYRTSEHNAAVGGSPKSQHLKGNAVDISMRNMKGITVDEFANIAERIGFDGIGKYHTFVHLDVRGYRARWDGRGEVRR